MTPLPKWFQTKTEESGLARAVLAKRARVPIGTISDTLTTDHIPKLQTLFRIADALDTPHSEILPISGHLKRGDELPSLEATFDPDEELTWQLITEFRQLPDDWKPDVVATVHTFVGLAKRSRDAGDQSAASQDQHR